MAVTEYRILFVCLGNICRSPTAEAVMRKKVETADGSGRILVDSAGTQAWHVGKAPDPRATAAAARRGYTMAGLAGRQVAVDDFARFDRVLAMDSSNLADLRDLHAQAGRGPEPQLFLDYSPAYEGDVPDPYYGGADGFTHVLNCIEDAADGLLAELKRGQG